MVKHADNCWWQFDQGNDFGTQCKCGELDRTNPVGWWHLVRGHGEMVAIRRLNADGTATILHLAPGTEANAKSVPVGLELLRRAEG